METKKELVVSAIQDGTVIDHIPTEAVYQVIRILGLEKYKDEVLIGNYLHSNKLGRKGIIKIKNKHFTKDEVSKIALVAPFASIINIEDYNVTTNFDVVDKENLKLKCHYCEKFTTKETMKFSE